MKIIHARPFNHFCPGKRTEFVVSDSASQISRIEAGKQRPALIVGDLTTCRDFTDIRDVVNAYIALAEYDIDNGIYNISSGISISFEKY